MSFQQKPPRRPPACPWCGEEMVPCADGRAGRLCCPTDEPVEYRIGGGRWYFYGRQNGLDEPFPPAPDPAPTTAGDEEDDSDPLGEALRIVSTAWADDDSDGVTP